MTTPFSPVVRRKLRYYVYVYVNPLDGKVFYVGKGRGNRAFSHLKASGESKKAAVIKEIRAADKEPIIEILAHGLPDEKTALKIEAAVIDLLGKRNLTNKVGGYGSREYGRMGLEQIKAIYDPSPVQITEPTLLLRISRRYRHTMTPWELYDATRGNWTLGDDREQVELAIAVYAGVIREVYKVEKWLPAGSTFTNRPKIKPEDESRWEFVGRLADELIRKKYINRSVAHYFPEASQNPIKYVNVKQ